MADGKLELAGDIAEIVTGYVGQGSHRAMCGNIIDHIEGAGWVSPQALEAAVYAEHEKHIDAVKRAEMAEANKAADLDYIAEMEAKVQEIRAALDDLDEFCPNYTDEDVITCGWKSTVLRLRKYMKGGDDG